MSKTVENPTTPKRDPNKPRKTGVKTVEGVVVGRNKTVIDPEEVYKLAQIGCKDIEIANWFGIDGNTLRYNFSVELEKGRAALQISLRRVMFNNAIQHNNTVMQIWLSKNFLGMSDNPVDTETNQILPWSSNE